MKFWKRLCKFLLNLSQKFRKPKARKVEVKPPPEIKEKPKPKFVSVRVGGGIVSAEVVKENPLTLWVRLSNGDVVKRHKEKHLVE